MIRPVRKLYRRLRYGAPIIVVSGLPRSGTSMAMKMLDAAGFATVTDNNREADIDNPKGYFEDDRVLDLAKNPDKSWLLEARGKVVKIISHLLKELPPEHNYKVLFMNRKVQEVLASQAKMLERRGETSDSDDERMIELFENDVWKAKYRLKTLPCFDWLDLHYKDVVESPREQAERVNQFLGGNLDVDRMAGVVDSSLYRNRR